MEQIKRLPKGTFIKIIRNRDYNSDTHEWEVNQFLEKKSVIDIDTKIVTEQCGDSYLLTVLTHIGGDLW